jgi:hypothetical protein
MRKALTIIGILTAASPQARADFSYFCGQGQEKGAESAEVSLVDSSEGPMKLYLKGEEVPEERLGIKPTEGQVWIVTLDEGAEKGSRRFEFSGSSVQEFATSASGKDRKVGPEKKCKYRAVD